MKTPSTEFQASVVQTRDQFQSHWSGQHNFLIDPGLFAAQCTLPPLSEIVARVRDDKDVRILRNQSAQEVNMQSVADWFRGLPIEQAMTEPFNIGHFELDRFMGAGDILENYHENVLLPWQEFLRSAGFSWQRMKPYFFISGRSSLTPYHMDISHVLAWQCYGAKRFSALKDPEKYAPREVRERFVRDRKTWTEWYRMPEGLAEAEIRAFDMNPGALLWNVFLTPHWVSSLRDEPAMSINISHGGLAWNGQLCPFEKEARDWDPALDA